MGLSASKMMSYFFPNAEYRTLIFGLDGSGKTTILYKLKLNKIIDTIPTIGFNVETITFQNLTITIWDMSRHGKTSILWKHYFPNTAAIVYVVDSSDNDRFDEAKDELYRLLTDQDLSDIPLLVFANEQDLPQSKNPLEVTHALELSSIKNREWYIVGTSAHTGDGLFDGLTWLEKQLKT